MTTNRTLKVEARGEREIVMTRSFAAPRELVFEALTRPEHLKRWLGVFGGWSLAVCEIDFRVGGSYRYVWRGPNGEEMGMRGVYREIAPPDRFVATEKFDDPWYPGDAIGTTTLVDRAGTTTLTTAVLYSSREARDADLKSPMETGAAASYHQLEAMVADLVAR